MNERVENNLAAEIGIGIFENDNKLHNNNCKAWCEMWKKNRNKTNANNHNAADEFYTILIWHVSFQDRFQDMSPKA